MEHADALERIEIAAVEPDGLERLMAGDTPDAAAVAGHLAGCPDCTAELAQVRRISVIAREAVMSLPDPALRGRTLAFVRSVGRDRSGDPSATAPGPSVEDETPAPIDLAVARRRRRVPVLMGIAAAVVIVGVLGFASGGLFLSSRLDGDDREVAVLSDATQTNLRIEQRPDATHLALAATNGGTATGTLVFSPSGGELVMVADGLGSPPEGMEFGCWVEVNGQKRRIGHMYPGGGLQSWAGPVTGLANLPRGTVFGVSLVPEGGGPGQPLMTARL